MSGARSTGDRPAISVVVLCYRAGEFAVRFVEQLRRTLGELGLSHELVLVANYHDGTDGSDPTPQIVRELARADPTIKAVAKPKEGMMGWDMRSGLAAARGEAVAVIDGDGQIPASTVVAVYERLRAGRFDMVQTYRSTRLDGVRRLLVSRVYNWLLKALFPEVSVRDANSKPKILTRAALERLILTADDWFIDAEIVIQASRLRFRIGEVPTVFNRNPQRESFVKVSAVFEFLWNLARYRMKTGWP